MGRPLIGRIDSHLRPAVFQGSIVTRRIADSGEGLNEGCQGSLATNAWGPIVETINVWPPPAVRYSYGVGNAVEGWVRGACDLEAGARQVGEKAYVDGHL